MNKLLIVILLTTGCASRVPNPYDIGPRDNSLGIVIYNLLTEHCQELDDPSQQAYWCDQWTRFEDTYGGY